MNRNDRSIVGLVTVAHALVHTYELTVPIFVGIWLAEFDPVVVGPVTVGVTEATVGAVVTAGYGLFGAGALPAGVLVDRIGSRRLIAACLVGMATAFLLLSLASGLVGVAAALLVWGAAASVYHPAGLTLISRGVEERGTGFAYHGAAGNLGIGVGPLVATLLLIGFGWSTVAALLALPALVAGAWALRADVDETAATATADGGEAADVGSVREFLAESHGLLAGSFLLVLAVAASSGLYYRGVLTFLPGLLGGLPGFEPVDLGTVLPVAVDADVVLRPERYFYAGLLLVGVGGQYLGGKLTDRIRVERGLVAGFSALVAVALLFPIAAAAGGAGLLALGGALGLSLFAIQPLYQATIAEHTADDVRGLSYGYAYLFVFGVGAVGGGVAGGVLTYADGTALFLVLAGIAATGVGLSALLLRAGSEPTGR